MSELRPIKRIGFVGLGRMGYPMAGHLAAAGFEIVAADTNAEALAAFEKEHGGLPGTDLNSLGADVDAVITMLPTSAIVREVILGANGVAKGLKEGTFVLDMSTSNPNDTKALSEELAPRGIHVCDAPVAGGVVFAKDGTLDILVGGDAAVAEHIKPLLMAMGKTIHYCGAVGSAHAMKAINNYVNAAVLPIYLEAITAGAKFGIDMGTLLGSLEASTLGRNHPYEKKVKKHVFTRAFATGMDMKLIAKDVQIAVDTMNGIGVPSPMSSATAALWWDASDKLGGTSDQSEIAKYWEQPAGLELTESSSE